MPDKPLTSRGTPRKRFDPLRDAPRANSAELEPEDDAFILDNGPGEATNLISAVRRQIVALGLSASVEGQAAICAAEGAVNSSGAARAACLHQLGKVMSEIRASKPAGEAKDATEDVLERMRQRKAGA